MLNIDELLASRPPRVGQTTFIGVDGHGGSGKSSLAAYLAQRLAAQIIHTDDFASWDNPLHWWPRVIQQVFTPIANGATTLSYRRSQWWDTHHPEPVVGQPVTPIMLLEGVSALRKEFRQYVSLSIFVDTPAATCLERGLARDARTGKPREELTRMWRQWLQDEEAYFARDRPRQYADVVIDGTQPFPDQIACVHDQPCFSVSGRPHLRS